MQATIAISPKIGLDPAAFMQVWGEESAEITGGDSGNYLGPAVGNVTVQIDKEDDLEGRIRQVIESAGAFVTDVTISSVEQGDGSLLVSVNPDK